MEALLGFDCMVAAALLAIYLDPGAQQWLSRWLLQRRACILAARAAKAKLRQKWAAKQLKERGKTRLKSESGRIIRRKQGDQENEFATVQRG